MSVKCWPQGETKNMFFSKGSILLCLMLIYSQSKCLSPWTSETSWFISACFLLTVYMSYPLVFIGLM